MDTAYICKDSDGNLLFPLMNMDEQTLSAHAQFTHCLAVILLDDDYLLGWNKWRNRWEIFGGCAEAGESARDCIVRECYEELGLQNSAFVYLGAMRVLLQPDYFSPEKRIELGGLYGLRLQGVALSSLQCCDRDEVTKLALYQQIKGHEPIAEIDEALLGFSRLY